MIYFPAAAYPPGSEVKCTYVSIPQAASTHAVVLSRPRWLWGCEMGANELGVVGGNEAVGSALADELGSEPRLLGMDLLRLALERGSTAKEAVDVCCSLLEAHGQGGGCEEFDKSWTYENGFLFADGKEAYVVETAGVHHWAVERIEKGCYRNISNGLSIRTAYTSLSEGIKGLCQANGWWDGTSAFDWKSCVGFGGRFGTSSAALGLGGREAAGREFLEGMAKEESDPHDAALWCAKAASILRDEDSGICFRSTHGFCSTGSQISWIPDQEEGGGSGGVASHLFTAASDPMVACYKRFEFARDGVGKEEGDNFGSLDLWRSWRNVALKGGLAKAKKEDVKGRMAVLERAAMEAVMKEGGDKGFAEAVKAEMEILR